MGMKTGSFLSAVDSLSLSLDTGLLSEMIDRLDGEEAPITLIPFNNYAKYLLNLSGDRISAVIDNERDGWRYRGRKIMSLDEAMEVPARAFLCCCPDFSNEYAGMIKGHNSYGGQRIFVFPPTEKYKKDKEAFRDIMFYRHLEKEMHYRDIHTMLDRGKIFTLLEFLKSCKTIKGDVLEYGVWLGGSAFALAKAMEYSNMDKDLVLADLFELSDSKSAYSIMCMDEIHFNLSFFKRLRLIQANLEKNPDILAGLSFAFIHYDAPFSRDVLQQLYKSLSAGGIMVIDNYNNTIGNFALFDKWFTSQTDVKPMLSPGNLNQGIVIKNV